MHGLVEQFAAGTITTLTVFASSAILGTAVGFCVAAATTSQLRLAAAVGTAYVNVIRGVPELLIILVAFFGGTGALSWAVGRYVEINAFAAGVGALTIVFGGYAAEVFRGAIKAIAAGQTEAAASLGLGRLHTWHLIIVPQMIPLALPAYGNLCISLIKDTSLVSIVGLSDVMRVAYVGAGSFRAPLPFYLAASAIYLAFTSCALSGFRVLERRFEPKGGRA
ncbi:amino acid ABC transporter membrane protein 1, PAAT family [Rhizobium tibeticum]|uniref:Amino acid ABC transporter membrane protein 1, PAAT family n=1 Tax=Rhizobium tibeticum TaxID=501024 RepID=A0A1H8H1R9_9HYPH|nr:ABC transporter permease subunit [Rhizobium tibeticum]SEH63715.1 Histidine transport system permease protein HisQ [Rhizobium tibeticum]SEN49970.1 amino acid ABC transporter membrane protein 1, PAAT family [Rhizobium tibeticum]